MTSTHKQECISHVNELCTNPEWCLVLSKILSNLHNRYYGEWQDVIVQKWERFSYDIYDAFAFGNVWAWMCLGEIVCARIYLGSEPGKDHDEKGNNDKLQRGLSEKLFNAIFCGGNGDSDGYLDVNEPIEMDMTNLETNEHIIKSVAGRFPLEVGYTEGSKTIDHLRSEMRLARWPYYSKEIYLLKKIHHWSETIDFKLDGKELL